MELLNLKIIKQYLSNDNISYIEKAIIFNEINSTNTYLSELPKNKINDITICMAESQTVGKGRLGRKWISPFAQNIYLSLAWHFNNTSLQDLSGLSIAIAVGAANALKNYGIGEGIELKWPNDILWNKEKFAGILIETSTENNDSHRVIIGIGVNLEMSDEFTNKISQPWTNIAKITNSIPERNKLTGLLLNQLLNTLKIYEKNRLTPFIDVWQNLDVTLNKNVTLTTPHSKICGKSHGINEKGFLLLKTKDGQMHTFASGEVSLRITQENY